MTQQRFKKQIQEYVDLLFAAAADHDVGVEEWAIKAQLHVNTIKRIASGETRFPMFQTILAMGRAVDLVFYTRITTGRKRGAA